MAVQGTSYPTVGQGGDVTPPWSFWYVAVFQNNLTFFFYFSGKPLIFLTRSNIFYGWWPLFVERSWKNKYFQSKMACPPATYDVISHNHSNWPSLNLPQNVREGWTNSYWKRQVLMFYPQGKNSGKPYGGIHPPPPHPLYVRALSHNFILILIRKLSLRVSFFPVSLLAKSATIAPKIKRQTSYASHMWVFHPFPPLPPI